MNSARDVVITGVGVVSPVGIGKDALWESLRAGQSGVRSVPELANSPFPVKIGGNIIDFDGKQFIQPRKSMKVMCREIQIGFSSAVMAMNDAKLETGKANPDRFGVVFGCDMFYGEVDEIQNSILASLDKDRHFDFKKWGDHGIGQLYPLWMLKYLPNMAACHIGISQDARGPNNTVTLGEVSSLLAFIEGCRVIQRDCADVMIVGGTGTRLNVTPLSYRGPVDLSRRNDEPELASRPFDAKRDGMVNGEGAGAFILESRQHAEARGAKILARVLGVGQAHEPWEVGVPATGTGQAASIRNSLQSAGLKPADIGHVNAHGLSTIESDRAEASAIRGTLGDVPVTANKSFFGNLGAGSGAVEMAVCVKSLETGEIPYTMNYDFPDPECPINVVRGESQKAMKPAVMTLNKSGTGQAAAVILGAE